MGVAVQACMKAFECRMWTILLAPQIQRRVTPSGGCVYGHGLNQHRGGLGAARVRVRLHLGAPLPQRVPVEAARPQAYAPCVFWCCCCLPPELRCSLLREALVTMAPTRFSDDVAWAGLSTIDRQLARNQEREWLWHYQIERLCLAPVGPSASPCVPLSLASLGAASIASVRLAAAASDTERARRSAVAEASPTPAIVREPGVPPARTTVGPGRGWLKGGFHVGQKPSKRQTDMPIVESERQPQRTPTPTA